MNLYKVIFFNLSNSTQEMFEGVRVPINTIKFETNGTNHFNFSKFRPDCSNLSPIIEEQATQDSFKTISLEKLESLQKWIHLMANQYSELLDENKKLKERNLELEQQSNIVSNIIPKQNDFEAERKAINPSGSSNSESDALINQIAINW